MQGTPPFFLPRDISCFDLSVIEQPQAKASLSRFLALPEPWRAY